MRGLMHTLGQWQRSTLAQAFNKMRLNTVAKKEQQTRLLKVFETMHRKSEKRWAFTTWRNNVRTRPDGSVGEVGWVQMRRQGLMCEHVSWVEARESPIWDQLPRGRERLGEYSTSVFWVASALR